MTLHPKKPHLSPSQIDSFTRCGEAYRRRYIEKQIIPPPFSMVKGSCVHTAGEENFKQKIESKVDLPVKQIEEIAAASFEGRVKAEGVLLSEEEEGRGIKVVSGEAKDSTVRMARIFGEVVAPKYQPIAVEEEVRIELPGPRDIVGRIDLTLENGLQDTKTGAKAKNQADIDKDVQFTTYAAMYEKKYGKPPERIIIDNVIDRVSAKTAKVVTQHISFETQRDGVDIAALAARINTVTKGIEAGMFMPATPGAWWCSAKSCGYWRTCPYVNGARRSAAEDADA